MIDLDDMTVETPETVAARIRRALPYMRPDELVVAPDCGMKYLPRDVGLRQARVAGGRRRDHPGGGLTWRCGWSEPVSGARARTR